MSRTHDVVHGAIVYNQDMAKFIRTHFFVFIWGLLCITSVFLLGVRFWDAASSTSVPAFNNLSSPGLGLDTIQKGLRVLHLTPSRANAKAKTVELPALMYHYIRTVPDKQQDPLGFNLSVTPEHFKQQMSYLISQGYTTVSPADLVDAMNGKSNLPPKAVLLTFDDGYEDFYQNVFPVLEEHHLEATLFVITGFVGEADGRYVSWSQIEQMDASGLVTIGAHTETHVDLTHAADAYQQIVGSKEALESHLHHPVVFFAYPSGRYNSSVEKILQDAGFAMAFTTHPGISHSLKRRFESPRVRISGAMTTQAFAASLARVLEPSTIGPTLPADPANRVSPRVSSQSHLPIQ